MTTEVDESNRESGSEFRQKFEATMAENSTLRNQLAEKLGVSGEDLKGVPADQIVAKAAEIAEQRKLQEEQTLKRALEARGLSGTDLEAALAQLTGGTGEQPAPAAEATPTRTPFASTGALGGGPVGSLPTDGLYGVDRIAAALKDKKK